MAKWWMPGNRMKAVRFLKILHKLKLVDRDRTSSLLTGTTMWDRILS